LAVRPVLDTERPDTHGWSLGASDGDHNIRLDAMDEGLTRLVASLPTHEAESKGEMRSNFLLLVASKARLFPCLACSFSPKAACNHVRLQHCFCCDMCQPVHDISLSNAYAVYTNSHMCHWCVSEEMLVCRQRSSDAGQEQSGSQAGRLASLAQPHSGC